MENKSDTNKINNTVKRRIPLTFKYVRDGLFVYMRSSRMKPLHSKLLVSPAFVDLLLDIDPPIRKTKSIIYGEGVNIKDKGTFDLKKWDELSQTEKNFLYDINQKCNINNKDLEIEFLRETEPYIDRLRILDGELTAGNISDKLLRELNNLIDDLYLRHQITAMHRTNYKKKIGKYSKILDTLLITK